MKKPKTKKKKTSIYKDLSKDPPKLPPKTDESEDDEEEDLGVSKAIPMV